METGRVVILRYAIVHDCGRQLHPVIVDGQIVGGFAQGLGVVLGEHVVHDDDGQLLTNTLMDYPIPRADDMPPLGDGASAVRAPTTIRSACAASARARPGRRPRRSPTPSRTRVRGAARHHEPGPHAAPGLHVATRRWIRARLSAGGGRHGKADIDHRQEPGRREATSAIVDSIVASRGALQGPFTMFLHSPELAGRVAHLGAYVQLRGLARHARARARRDDGRARARGRVRLGARRRAARGGSACRSRRSPRSARTTAAACRPEDAQIVRLHARSCMRKHRVDEATVKALIGALRQRRLHPAHGRDRLLQHAGDDRQRLRARGRAGRRGAESLDAPQGFHHGHADVDPDAGRGAPSACGPRPAIAAYWSRPV